MMSRQFLAFLVAGGTAAAANIGSRIAFDRMLPYVPSIIAAWCVGNVTAFVLNRLFVFREAARPLRYQAAWFIAINLAAVVQTLLISLLLRDWVFPATGMRFHPETLAHAAGVVVPVVTSYFGHKHLSFRTGAARA